MRSDIVDRFSEEVLVPKCSETIKHLSTGLDELDELLGGGFVQGSQTVFLINPSSVQTPVAKQSVYDNFRSYILHSILKTGCPTNLISSNRFTEASKVLPARYTNLKVFCNMMFGEALDQLRLLRNFSEDITIVDDLDDLTLEVRSTPPTQFRSTMWSKVLSRMKYRGGGTVVYLVDQKSPCPDLARYANAFINVAPSSLGQDSFVQVQLKKNRFGSIAPMGQAELCLRDQDEY